jgi:hypothetical protein
MRSQLRRRPEFPADGVIDEQKMCSWLSQNTGMRPEEGKDRHTPDQSTVRPPSTMRFCPVI